MIGSRERHFLEATLEGVETAFDLATDNEAVRAIPVIGTAFKVCRGLDDLRSRILAAKLTKFLTDPGLQSEATKNKLRQKVEESPTEAASVGEALFLVIDRLIDLDKPAVLARVFVAYIDDTVSASELKRVAQAVDLAFGEDLNAFLQTDQMRLHDETQPWMTLLENTGLTTSIVNRAPPGRARSLYSVTPIGHVLWNAWHHVPASPNTAVNTDAPQAARSLT